MSFYKIIFFAFLLLITFNTNATQTLSVTCCSYHFDRDKKYNERNLGVLYTVDYKKNNYIMLGGYDNSVYSYSNLVGFGRRWELSEDFTASLAFGVVTGYSQGTTLFLAPGLTYKNFASISGIPFDAGVLALSFTLIRW